MKAILPLLLALAALPAMAVPTEPAPVPAANQQAAPDWQDAECLALENYLRAANRAALLAEADALDQVLARSHADDNALKQALTASGLRNYATLAAAMAAVPGDGLPPDSAAYFRALFDSLQNPPGQPYDSETAYLDFMARQLPEIEAQLALSHPRAGRLLGLRGTLLNWHGALIRLMQSRSENRDLQQIVRQQASQLRREAAALGPVSTLAEARLELTRRAYANHNICTLDVIGDDPWGEDRVLALSLGREVDVLCAGKSPAGYVWQLAEPLPADSPVSVRWEDVSKQEYFSDFYRPDSMPEQLRNFTLNAEREGTVKLRLVFTREGETEPLFSRERELRVVAPATTETVAQAVLSLSDAECLAIHDYLRRVSRAGLLAYADALEHGMKRQEDEDFHFMTDVFFHDHDMARAMGEVSTEGLPEGFGDYLRRAAGITQQLDGTQPLCAATTASQEAALMARYPRAAACLPLADTSKGQDEFHPGVFAPLRRAIHDAKQAERNDLTAPEKDPEKLVRALRRAAEALATPATTSAAEVRHSLLQRAMGAAAQLDGTAAMQALASYSDSECLSIEGYLRQVAQRLRTRYAEAPGPDVRALLPELLRESPREALPGDCRAFIEGILDNATMLAEFRHHEELARTISEENALDQLREQLADAHPRAALLLEEDRLCQRLLAPVPAPEPELTPAAARLALTRLALHTLRADAPRRLSLPPGGEGSACFFTCAATGYRWQLAEPLPEDAPVSLHWESRRGKGSPNRKAGFSPLEPECGVDITTLHLRAQRAGSIRIPLVFTREGDTEALFTTQLHVTITPEAN